MKVVAVMGSPRKEGRTNTLIREFLRGVKDAGHEALVYDVNKMNIRGCQACYTCKNNNCDCIVQDDLEDYWKKLHEADVLIVGSPNYASNICGPMVTYMNRHYCLLDKDWNVRIHPGIKLFGVFSQGRAEADCYTDVYKWYLGDFLNRKMILQDILVCSGKDSDKPGDELMKRAYLNGYRI
jgi:multimeric flavodoxin WrbA